jgi:hypothetical protein
MWRLDRPPEVLDLIADLMVGRRFRPDLGDDEPGELYGMAFRSEGWGTDTRPGTMAHHHALRMAGDHQLHRHPARVEVRMMYAVDREQITYTATVTRGRDAPAERLIAYPDGHGEGFGPDTERLLKGHEGDAHPTGAVLEALDKMVEHLLGVPALARPGSTVGDPSWS